MKRLIVLVVVAAACSEAAPAPTTTPDLAATTTTVPATGWQRLPNLPTPRSEMAGAALNGKIYVPGGYLGSLTGGFESAATVEVFDPASDTWSQVADLPEGRNHHMAVALDDFLYVMGGYGPDGQATDTTWRYDPVTDSWSELAPIPGVVAAGSAVTLDGLIYLVGGSPNGVLCYRYTPALDEWEEVAALAEPRDHTAAAVLDGKIYALGGRWGPGEIASVEVYDPGVGLWAPGPALLEERSGFAAVAWHGSLLVVGGEWIERLEALRTVVRLDPASGEWQFLAPLPVGLHGMAAAVVGDVVYVLGGSRRAADIANVGDALALRP